MRFFRGYVPDALGGGAASVWLVAFCWKYPLTDISSTENIKKQLQWGAINQFYTGMANERCRWSSLFGWCSWRTFFYAMLQINIMTHVVSCIRNLPGWKEELDCSSEEVLGGYIWRWKIWSRIVSVIFRSWGSTLDESCVRKSTPPTSLSIRAPVGCFNVQEKKDITQKIAGQTEYLI